MLQLITLLLCAIAALISSIPMQLALLSTNPKRFAALFAGALILLGGVATALIGGFLSFSVLPSATP